MSEETRDIIVGSGRVPYCGNRRDGDMWALPGGKKTIFAEVATQVATAIAAIIDKQGK